jgi:hypothetical protein
MERAKPTQNKKAAKSPVETPQKLPISLCWWPSVRLPHPPRRLSGPRRGLPFIPFRRGRRAAPPSYTPWPRSRAPASAPARSTRSPPLRPCAPRPRPVAASWFRSERSRQVPRVSSEGARPVVVASSPPSPERRYPLSQPPPPLSEILASVAVSGGVVASFRGASVSFVSV